MLNLEGDRLFTYLSLPKFPLDALELQILLVS